MLEMIFAPQDFGRVADGLDAEFLDTRFHARMHAENAYAADLPGPGCW